MNRADIVKKVNAALERAGDVVPAGTLVRATTGYDTDTGQATSTEASTPCKVLFDRSQQTIKDFLSGVTIAPTDLVAWLGYMTFGAKGGDVLRMDGQPDRTVVWCEDLLQLGALYLVVVR